MDRSDRVRYRQALKSRLRSLILRRLCERRHRSHPRPFQVLRQKALPSPPPQVVPTSGFRGSLPARRFSNPIVTSCPSATAGLPVTPGDTKSGSDASTLAVVGSIDRYAAHHGHGHNQHVAREPGHVSQQRCCTADDQGREKHARRITGKSENCDEPQCQERDSDPRRRRNQGCDGEPSVEGHGKLPRRQTVLSRFLTDSPRVAATNARCACQPRRPPQGAGASMQLSGTAYPMSTPAITAATTEQRVWIMSQGPRTRSSSTPRSDAPRPTTPSKYKRQDDLGEQQRQEDPDHHSSYRETRNQSDRNTDADNDHLQPSSAPKRGHHPDVPRRVRRPLRSRHQWSTPAVVIGLGNLPTQ
jgi:hypothetical protein